MSLTRSSIILSAAVIAGLVLSPEARAQCHHGGGGGPGRGFGLRGGPRGPGMHIGLALLRQQQQMQQLQLLVLQKQQLQKLELLVRDLGKADPAAIAKALESPLAETRWAAAQVVALQSLPFQDGLIKLLTDQNPFVRQAARQGLIHLSTAAQQSTLKGRAKARRVDFGPLPRANRVSRASAARRWRAWWKRLDAKRAEQAKRSKNPNKLSTQRGGKPALLSTIKVDSEGPRPPAR